MVKFALLCLTYHFCWTSVKYQPIQKTGRICSRIKTLPESKASVVFKALRLDMACVFQLKIQWVTSSNKGKRGHVSLLLFLSLFKKESSNVKRRTNAFYQSQSGAKNKRGLFWWMRTRLNVSRLHCVAVSPLLESIPNWTFRWSFLPSSFSKVLFPSH